MRDRHCNRLDYWCARVERRAARSFGPRTGTWAASLLRQLDARPDRTVTAPDLCALADELQIPGRFLSRALASTHGLVSVDPGPPVCVALHRTRLLHSKIAVGPCRGEISPAHRLWLFRADFHICGHCGHQFEPSHLEVDHLIPLAVRGADEPANWISLCRRDSAEQHRHARYGFIRYYRGELVRRSVGVRFRDGFLWPVVNGSIRRERRAEWPSVSDALR